MPPNLETKPQSKPARTVAVTGHLDERQRQRAMRVDVRISKQAMQVVLPTNQQIGPWQSRAARLLALAEKLQATGRHDPSVADEAEALLTTIEAHRRKLDAQVQALPADIAGSTRLEDTARALESVGAVLVRTLKLLKRRRAPAKA